MEVAACPSVFANTPESPGRGVDAQLPGPLEHEIRAIYQCSPLYGRRFPLPPETLQRSCYREVPILTKKEILDQGTPHFFADYAEIEREFTARNTNMSTLRFYRPAHESGHGRGAMERPVAPGLSRASHVGAKGGSTLRQCDPRVASRTG
jgi:hypothetical protein